MAISRKDFVGALTGRRRASASPARSPRSRTASTPGAHIFRVHDVAAAADFLAVRAALAGEAPPSRDLALAEELRHDRPDRLTARRARPPSGSREPPGCSR